MKKEMPLLYAKLGMLKLKIKTVFDKTLFLSLT